MKQYSPDPQTVKDGLTIEHRFWRACFGELERRCNEGFYFYIRKDDDGSYWATFEGDSGQRSSLIDEFTPAEASRLVRDILKGCNAL